jgi:hypothetical protein
MDGISPCHARNATALSPRFVARPTYNFENSPGCRDRPCRRFATPIDNNHNCPCKVVTVAAAGCVLASRFSPRCVIALTAAAAARKVFPTQKRVMHGRTAGPFVVWLVRTVHTTAWFLSSQSMARQSFFRFITDTTVTP